MTWIAATAEAECSPGARNCAKDHGAIVNAPNIPNGGPTCPISAHYTAGVDIRAYIHPDMSGTYLDENPYPGHTCHTPFDITTTVLATNEFEVRADWNNDWNCVGWTAYLTYDQYCWTASGVVYNDDHPDDAIPTTWGRLIELAYITEGSTYVPLNSHTTQGAQQFGHDKITTANDLSIFVTLDGLASAGSILSLKSNRGSADTITQPKPTDETGHTTSHVETQDQTSFSGLSEIRDEYIEQANVIGNGSIGWTPAKYKNTFLRTCYVTNLEMNHQSGSLVTAHGLSASEFYWSSFLDRVAINGTGIGLNGKRIKWDHDAPSATPNGLPIVHWYRYAENQNCTEGKFGTCLSESTSSAVKREIIPFFSEIQLDSMAAYRIADDRVGGTNLYHVDIFFDQNEAGCTAFGTLTNDGVSFLYPAP